MNERLTGEEQLGQQEITQLVTNGLLGHAETATQRVGPDGNRAVMLGGNRHIVQRAGELLEDCTVIPWGGL